RHALSVCLHAVDVAQVAGPGVFVSPAVDPHAGDVVQLRGSVRSYGRAAVPQLGAVHGLDRARAGPGDDHGWLCLRPAALYGAHQWDIFWRIYLPLSKPALTAYGVITALSAWNMYLWPLIVVQSEELKPVTLVIAQFSGSMNTQLNLMMAAVAISLTPIFLL